MATEPTTTPFRIFLARLAACPLFVLLFSLAIPGPGAAWRQPGVDPLLMGAALLVLLAQESGDLLERFLVRARGGDTELHRLLDPLADSLTHLGAFLCLMWVGLAPLWLLVVMAWREGVVATLRIVAARRGSMIGPRFTLRLNAMCQATAAGVLVLLMIVSQVRPGLPLEGLAQVFAWILMLVNVASVADYYLAYKGHVGG